MSLPLEIIHYILSFQKKEYYWNKYTKHLHIRFQKNYFDELSKKIVKITYFSKCFMFEVKHHIRNHNGDNERVHQFTFHRINSTEYICHCNSYRNDVQIRSDYFLF